VYVELEVSIVDRPAYLWYLVILKVLFTHVLRYLIATSSGFYLMFVFWKEGPTDTTPKKCHI
jgi:hypothetical protein